MALCNVKSVSSFFLSLFLPSIFTHSFESNHSCLFAYFLLPFLLTISLVISNSPIHASVHQSLLHPCISACILFSSQCPFIHPYLSILIYPSTRCIYSYAVNNARTIIFLRSLWTCLLQEGTHVRNEWRQFHQMCVPRVLFWSHPASLHFLPQTIQQHLRDA